MNMNIGDFSIWMQSHTRLSASSIYKYTRAIITISNDMLDLHVIYKNLLDMSLHELDIAIMNTLSHPDFIKKNKTGNKMYSNSLKQYRYFCLDTSDSDEAYENIVQSLNESSLTQTEKESIIKARIGQGQYRKGLLNKYEHRCIVTGIDNAKILMASHIKPWSVCLNHERIDSENGLLLSANLDRLFDSGLITFDKNGKLYISSFVGKENQKRLNISENIYVNLKASLRLIEYMQYHQDILFVR